VWPVWLDTVTQMGGGSEVRNAWWADALHHVEFDLGTMTLANFRTFVKHFNARRARVRTFPFTDRTAFSVSGEAFATGNGTAGPFQLQRNDGDSANAWNRKITKVIPNSEVVYVNAVAKARGTDYTIDNSTGLVTFLAGHFPANGTALSWDGQHYVPVRYDMTEIGDARVIMWSQNGQQLVDVRGVKMVETRDFT
jgi:uncharacterized protein (TIGR02217 family)